LDNIGQNGVSAMARRIRESILDSRDARLKLKIRGKPYWRSIGSGLHVGYRKGKDARRWVARIYVGDGHYVVERIGSADDFADADGADVLTFWQAQERARQLATKRTTRAGQRMGPYTVAKAIEDYLEHIAVKPSHYDVKRRLAAYVPAKLASMELAKLTKADVAAWHRAIAQEPPRVRTKLGERQRHRDVDMRDPEIIRRRQDSANRILGMLVAALNLAVNEENAPEGSWRYVQPFKDVARSRMRYLTVAECKRLLNACDPHFRDLVHALLLTGCRYQEVARLRAEDFNPDAGTLHIKQSKTGKARHVNLNDEGQEFFAQLTAGRGASEIILGRIWGKSIQAKPMAAACQRAKINPAIGLHQLRHTFASLAVMNGTPLMVIANALGHTSTRMVEKHYGHLSQSYLAEAIRKGAPRFGMVKASSVRPIR
jgi:integrase